MTDTVQLGRWEWEGSISTGTMQPRHLIPRFLEVLQKINQASYDGIMDSYHNVIVCGECKELDCDASAYCECVDDCNDRFDTEEASYCLDALFEALQWAAAPGYTFGSSEGDGSDYGFWWGAESMWVKGDWTGDDYKLLCNICQEELDEDGEFVQMDLRTMHKFYNFRGFEPQCDHCGHEV